MVYIKLTPSLVPHIDTSLLETVIISSTIYLKYSSLRHHYPDLNLQPLLQSQNVISDLTIKEMQIPPPPAAHIEWMRSLQLKHDRRVYEKMVDSKKATRTYFSVTPDEGIREMEKSISFGLTFIFSFFLAGISGYLLGKYLLEYDHINSMIVCIFFVMGTLIVETLLFVIRSNRMDKVKAYKDKLNEGQNKPQRKFVPTDEYIQQKKAE